MTRILFLTLPLLFALSSSPLVGASNVVVYSATTTSGLNLTVFDDDSYSLGIVDGETWLVSGNHGFHSNGVWYLLNSNSSSNATMCSTLQDTDCRGSDITYLNSTTSPSVCCEACANTPGCGAWTLTGNTEKDVPWADRCYLKTDCSGASSYSGHTSGSIVPPSAQLVRISSSPSSGSDPTLGAFTGYGIQYKGGNTPFIISFKYYPQVDSIVFDHSFPAGAVNLNVTAVINTTSSALLRGEFSASTMPSSAFPVWLPAQNQDAAALGSATWAGRFASSISSPNGGAAYAVSTLCSNGAEGGPIVLWLRKEGAIGTGDTLVLGPNSNFKGSIMGRSIQNEGCAAGLNGYVKNAAVGTRSSILATFSRKGITDAMHKWGGVLQTQYTTKKIYDPMSQELSFWTDNGAYYDWYAYEPDITSKGVPQDVLSSVFSTFRNGTYGSIPLPVKHVMLDAYWMYNSRPDGNCKINDSFWDLPFPRPSSLSSELGGVGVILYNGPQCALTTYADDWPLVYSLYWNQGWGQGALSEIAGQNSSAFYSSLFTRLSQYSLTGFTQDFLDFHHLLFPDFLEDPAGNDLWQAGQAQAALDVRMPVQYCMAEPADLLNSVRFNAVTNARSSQDYGAGSGSSWRIASTSLLLSSVGLRASKDNFWSGNGQTDRGREPSPFLSGVVTALSHGPVGFADKIFAANPDVLWPTVNEVGTLLHASRPATWLDAQWSGSGLLAAGDVRSTNSQIGGFSYYSLLAVGVGRGVIAASLSRNDLWPLPDNNISYLLWQYNNSACYVRNGQSSACVSELGGPVNGAMLPSPPSPDETSWELWSIAPTLSNGITFLGEYKKYVAMSPDRFENLVVQGKQSCIDLVGGKNEIVSVSWIWSNSTVGIEDVTLDGNGSFTFCLSS